MAQNHQSGKQAIAPYPLLLHKTMSESSQEKRFYVLRVISGKEEKTKEMIDREKERKPLEGHIFEVIVPTENIMVQRGSKKKIVEKPSMPGYILIEAILNNDIVHTLRNMPEIIGFLGANNQPEPLATYEVERMMRRLDNQDDQAVNISFIVGESVKVTDGPFTGFSATVEEIYNDKKKLKVMVKIFGRKTPLELGYHQVEKG